MDVCVYGWWVVGLTGGPSAALSAAVCCGRCSTGSPTAHTSTSHTRHITHPPTQPTERCVQMGFFAEAGPLQVFVSNHLLPEGFEFNTAHEPCYQTADGEQKVVPGSEVRLRIVGTRVDASDIVSAWGGWVGG